MGQRSLTVATGAFTLRRSWRVWPRAQPSQPGRFTTTATLTVSPGVSGVLGVRRPLSTASGMGLPSGPNACVLSSLPPNGCTVTRARATGSLVRLAPDHASAPATTASSAARTTTPRPIRRVRVLGLILEDCPIATV